MVTAELHVPTSVSVEGNFGYEEALQWLRLSGKV